MANSQKFVCELAGMRMVEMRDIIRIAGANNGITDDELREIVDEVLGEAGKQPLEKNIASSSRFHPHAFRSGENNRDDLFKT